jgi:chromate transporter
LAALLAFAALLLVLPLLAWISPAMALLEVFYRAGALVFGGGHVVLPLLEEGLVAPGWVSQSSFLAGYGAAQAVPGPLFTLAAYLGAIAAPAPGLIAGGVLALIALMLPGLLLVYGMLPFWGRLRHRPGLRAAVEGANAAVVGLLLAALYDPVWTSAVGDAVDFAAAVAAVLLLMVAKAPPWMVVILLGTAGALRGVLG